MAVLDEMDEGGIMIKKVSPGEFIDIMENIALEWQLSQDSESYRLDYVADDMKTYRIVTSVLGVSCGDYLNFMNSLKYLASTPEEKTE